MAGLILKTPPALEPVTTAEMREQLRLGSDTSFDDELDRLVTAAREKFESDTNRALITQTWNLYRDCWPRWQHEGLTITVPRPLLQSVTSITYVDNNGTPTVWDDAEYDVDITSQPGRILPAYGFMYPQIRGDPNGIDVEFDAGYGDAAEDVPQLIRHAIRLLAAYWFSENRSLAICMTAQQMEAAHRAYESIVLQYKMGWAHAR